MIHLGFQVEQDSSVNDASPHIANIGRMVEVNTVALMTLSCCCLILYQIAIYIHPFLVFAFFEGHGKQDEEYSERYILWQNKGYS